ncbi:hypothetical protein AYX14_06629 [Cryptococcus neoformans]|nr:hypothetical protein AYX14_06629 [Cryptococcus neoformans var. grubii]
MASTILDGVEQLRITCDCMHNNCPGVIIPKSLSTGWSPMRAMRRIYESSHRLSRCGGSWSLMREARQA